MDQIRKCHFLRNLARKQEISNLSQETLKIFTEGRVLTIFVQAFIYIVLNTP